jgi:hypothetical protein
MNRALRDHLDDDAFVARMAANVARMEWLAEEILGRAREAHAGIPCASLDALLMDAPRPPPSLSRQWYAAARA